MKKDVHLNFNKTFWSALFLLLATVFAYLAIHQGMQKDWIGLLLCVIAPLPFLILVLIVRKREFTASWIRGGNKWWPCELDLRFNYAGLWFWLFQRIFLNLHKRNKITYQSKVHPGNKTRVPIHRRFRSSYHGYSAAGIYSEYTKRTGYTDWRDGNTYYSIKGRLLYIRVVLPDQY